MELKDIDAVYFVGAGGIGMAALERYFLSCGKTVAGYDRTPSALTAELEKEGVAISFEDTPESIPAEFRNPEKTLVVYTPAVPAENRIFRYFREGGNSRGDCEGQLRGADALQCVPTDRGDVCSEEISRGGFEVLKRSAVLGAITRSSKGLCFSGTHGKTTTSSMAAHILHTSPTGCNAFLGGILLGYNSNLMLSKTSPYSVIEADEYDRSFHTLRPYVAVVTATDPDHLDIYGTEEAYLESFAHFTELIQPGGYLLIHTGLKLKPRPGEGVKTYTYSREEGDFHAANIRRGEGRIEFDFVHPEGVIKDIGLGVPVDINIDNAIAALGAVWLTGELTDEVARKAIGSYPGVERRFQFHLRPRKAGDKAIIDDYAHHPDELRSSIASVRALFPGRHLTVAFQPHLYSRTRDFAPEFAEALSAADSVILVDLYPAREKPIPGISSKTIFDLVKCEDKEMISKDDFVNRLKNRNFDILLTAGAGDLNRYVPELASAYKE